MPLLSADSPLSRASCSLSECVLTQLTETSLDQLIPPYLSSTSAQTTVRTLQPQLAATREERDKFASDNALLREEVNELKRKLRESVGRQREERLSEPSRGGPLPPPLSQQAPATGALPRRETSVSLSPQKKGRPGSESRERKDFFLAQTKSSLLTFLSSFYPQSITRPS